MGLSLPCGKARKSPVGARTDKPGLYASLACLPLAKTAMGPKHTDREKLGVGGVLAGR